MTTDQAADPPQYAVSAEFYDLLQAEDDRRRAERRFAGAARSSRVGIIDAGAGTGAATEVLVRAGAAPVHVVEPSPAMRTALLARLARLGADQRSRITVHPQTLPACALSEVADLVVAANVVGCLEPAERRSLWRAAFTALVPGGLLLFDPPPTALPPDPESSLLPPVRLGLDQYRARITRTPDRGVITVRFDYQVERDGEVLRQEQESFRMWPAAPGVLEEELEAAGMELVVPPDGDLVAARRPAPSGA
ncbi:class I SAM-dependent methyltransferase [Kitasatospora sp. NPDC006697]|uniref:class I SAM-dependent methyltransferase n=1 Tax=Kitasatospora sp. NPDC006697 TaxID=3364020 RepID=UPI0036BF11F9